MSTPATPWLEDARTGLDALADLTHAAASGRPHTLGASSRRPDQQLWDLVHRAYPATARALARPNGAFLRSAHLRPEVDSAGRQILVGRRHGHCIELLEAFGRALLSCPTALSTLHRAGPASPSAHLLPANERLSLYAVVARRLVSLGCRGDELAVRRLTGDILDELQRALRALPVEVD